MPREKQETGVDPKASRQIPGWASRRPLLALLGLLLAAAGGFGLWNYLTDPPKPWLVRWQITRYLKKQGGTSDFKVSFPFPSRAEMAKAPPKSGTSAGELLKGPRTGQEFDALKAEYTRLKTSALVMERELARNDAELKDQTGQLEALLRSLETAQTQSAATNVSRLQSDVNALRARVAALQQKAAGRTEWQSKEEALIPIVSDLWDFQRAWLAEAQPPGAASGLAQARAELTADLQRQLFEAPSYAAMYRLIGQELWVAEHLLASANPEHGRVGLGLALSASQHALGDAQNGWLAARICEGYVWPNLDLAEAGNRRSPFNLENLLNECANVFRQADEFQNVARTYQKFLAKVNDPQRADWARAQIAMAYDQAGDPKRALQYLRQIKATNDFAWLMRRVPRLEQQVKAN
jgi:hypothetical protein